MMFIWWLIKRAVQSEKPKRKRPEYDKELAEKTLAQFDSNGEWTGTNPYGAEAYFKRLHADKGDEYFEDESGE